jgi:hypothetical protein
MIERLEKEDGIVQTILSELQRQISLQSKDRAKLLERVGGHYHSLVERAVGVSKMGNSMQVRPFHDSQYTIYWRLTVHGCCGSAG